MEQRARITPPSTPSAGTDVVCLAGRLSGTNTLRQADIHPDALKYVNKTGMPNLD